MERAQLGQLNKADVQERRGRDEQRIEPLAPDTFEGGIDLIAGVGVDNSDFKPRSGAAACKSLNVPLVRVASTGLTSTGTRAARGPKSWPRLNSSPRVTC
jgi:hypothetical protein